MKRIIKKVFIVVVLILMSGCTTTSQSIKDRSGQEITIPASLDSIVSTSPATTEILVGLGLGDKIIAMDPYSKDVEGVRADALSINFINPDTEVLLQLKPDILITSSLNTTSGSDPFALLKEAGICVVTIPISTSIDSIKEDITFLGKVFNTEEQAVKMIEMMDDTLNEIIEIEKTIPEDKRKSVYFEISLEPNLFAVGGNTFLNDIIQIIGATNIYSSFDGWPQPSIESIISANPDVIITNVYNEPDAVEKIKVRTGFSNINAVMNEQVFLIDTNITSRSSQHSIVALEQIARLVYPEYYGK